MVALKAFALWLLVLALAVANGGLREAVLLALLPRPAAYLLSGLLLIAGVFAVAALAAPWLGPLRARGYRRIGLFWLVLTLVFEFAFGLLVRGASLASLWRAYTFEDGNLWPLVLVAVAVAPWAGARMRRLV